MWCLRIVDNADGTRLSTVVKSTQSGTIDNEQFSITTHLIENVPYPLFCSSVRWNNLNSLIEYRSGDIIIATYPKCGTTWIEQCVLLLLNDGHASNLDPASKNVYIPGSAKTGKIWLEAALNQVDAVQQKMGQEAVPISVLEFESMPGRRVIKTHAPVQLLLGANKGGLSGLPEGVKVIAMTRNPLDACVSSYYHAFNPYKSGWPFDAWATLWLSGNTVHGSWYTWTKDWYNACKTYPDRGLFLQYEHMKSNALTEVQRVADFLGISHTSDLLSRVVENSSFASMKHQSAESGGDKFNHLRKGEIGDWHNHFTDEYLVNQFKNKFETEMKETGLTLLCDV